MKLDFFSDIMADTLATEQDKQVKKLKRKLEGWREIILPLHSVLTWEKQWYPVMVFGVITIVYILLWLLEPPLLTILAGTGIILTLLDFFGPIFISNVFEKSSWNKNNEKQFEEIVKCLVVFSNGMQNTTDSFFKMRETSPRTYFTIVLGTLSSLAWMGATRDNLLLMYSSSVLLFLLPGLLRHAVIGNYLTKFMNMIAGFIKSQEKLVKTD